MFHLLRRPTGDGPAQENVDDWEQLPQTYPNPVPVNNNKYWVYGGWQGTTSNTLEDVNVESLDFISVIEKIQPWKKLKLPIKCILCDQRKQELPLLDQVHWLYFQCTSYRSGGDHSNHCRNFLVCADCVTTSSFRHQTMTTHANHNIVPIATRPLWSPIYDGSDLEQLQLFKTAQSEDEFFLYFPWFFHSFEGMDRVRDYYSELIFNEGMEKICLDLETGVISDEEAKDRQGSLVLCNFPVDWFMRTCLRGNWRMLHNSLQKLVDARIQLAACSMRLNALRVRLEGYVTEKEEVYGKDDIPNLFSDPVQRDLINNRGDRDYNSYMLPLTLLTILNDQIDQRQLKKVLFNAGDTTEDLYAGQAPELASANNAGYLMGQSHLSVPVFCESRRLWPIFRLLFRDHPEFAQLRAMEEVNDLALALAYRHPSWLPFLLKNEQIRKVLWSIQYQLIGLPVRYISNLESERPQASATTAIPLYRLYRILGDYDKAAEELLKMNYSEPRIAAELQLTFLEQGYFGRVVKCPLGIIRQDNDLLCVCLLSLTAGYAAIFLEGKWLEALKFAMEAYRSFCEASGEGMSREERFTRIRIELLVHRIILAAYRDLKCLIPKDAVLGRLQAIWNALTQLPPDPTTAELAWTVLDCELEVRKRGVRSQYREFESAYSSTTYLHTPTEIQPILEKFKSSRLLQGKDSVTMTILGRIELLQGELCGALQDRVGAKTYQQAAEKHFKEAACTVGLLDVRLFDATAAGTSSVVTDHAELLQIYQALRYRNDISRLRKIRILRVPLAPMNTTQYDWLLFQRASLRSLATEAGDYISYHRWNMRKYAGDHLVAAIVHPAETILRGETVHSAELALMASFNLSKAYTTLGNYYAAALNAMLHLSLTQAHQADAEAHQRAILVVLDVFSAAVTADPSRLQEKLPQMARVWNGWLDDGTMQRWAAGGPRCDEIDRFIDAACFLPRLSGRLGREANREELDHDAELEDALIQNLTLAFDLYEAMPKYVVSAIVPKLSLALGAVAAYVGNRELAIRSYWEGLRCTHSGDLYTISTLRCEAGKLMTLLAEQDPEHWLHVAAPGRSLLRSATDMFQNLRGVSGGVLKTAEANLYLFRSYVSEARARKKMLDEDSIKQMSSGEPIEEFVEKILGLALVARWANKILYNNEAVFEFIAERLTLAAPHEFHNNLIRLAENPVFVEMNQLILELSIITNIYALLQGKPPGEGFWNMVQRCKGGVLGYHYGRLVPPELIERIRRDPTAWRLYKRENALLDEGPQGMYDVRLDMHHLEVREANIPELNELRIRRSFRSATKQELASLVKGKVNTERNVIMVDWIRYRSWFVVICYNATTGEFSDKYIIRDISAKEVEQWVSDHICVPDDDVGETLDTLVTLQPLHPLVKPIFDFVSPGDLLIFSPAHTLNYIPLHAIPFQSPTDQPVIEYHPVMYASSSLVLKECVERALSREISGCPKGRFFCRYPEDQGVADDAVRQIARTLESQSNIRTTYCSGPEVTHTALTSQLPDADILHFHGHATADNLSRHLQIEPEPEPEPPSLALARGSAAYRLLYPSSPPKTSFSFQDAISASLRASLCLLLGCGSGVQEISKADDALGLVNGFLAAGATTVVATLWPLNSADAAEWAGYFYQELFRGDNGEGNGDLDEGRTEAASTGKAARCSPDQGTHELENLLDIATAMQRAVREMRLCRNPRCMRKSLKKRLGCHGQKVYRWAPFVAWGSWVCRKM